MSKFAFSVLNVGQGSGNFVEIYANDVDTVPTTTVLIDLGAEGASRSHHGPSVERVIASLKKMDDPEIACLVLSHSDTDHISMIEQLLSAFDSPNTKNPKKKVLTIKTFFYGGNYALYRKRTRKNVVDQVDWYMVLGTTPKSMSTNFSSYLRGGKPIYEDATLDFKIQILIGNAIKLTRKTRKKQKTLPLKDGVAVNTVSLVTVFESNDIQLITTGDATGITMLRANQIMGGGSGSFFYDPLMLTIPHHGSFSTAMAFTGERIRGAIQKIDQITLFARRCGAKILTVSAGNRSQFLHPSGFILNLFWKFASDVSFYEDVGAQPGSHFYTAYFKHDDGFELTTAAGDEVWPDDSDWYTVQSKVQIYSTDYFVRSNLVAVTEMTTGAPRGGKRKARFVDLMAELPTSPALPSPGSVVPLPAKKNFPPEEVGWRIDVSSNKGVAMTRIDPSDSSVAALNAIVAQAELHFGMQPLASSKKLSATPPTRLDQVPSPRVKRRSPVSSGLPRPRIRRL